MLSIPTCLWFGFFCSFVCLFGVSCLGFFCSVWFGLVFSLLSLPWVFSCKGKDNVRKKKKKKKCGWGVLSGNIFCPAQSNNWKSYDRKMEGKGSSMICSSVFKVESYGWNFFLLSDVWTEVECCASIAMSICICFFSFLGNVFSGSLFLQLLASW